MRIALGADHAGVELKDRIKRHLDARGIPCTDFGTMSAESVDYPDYARIVAGEVATGASDRGILVCGTGIGMAIAANKIAGIRAAAVVDTTSAALSREHNDANILALGARMMSPEIAQQIVDIFVDTPFSGGRHQRRLDKIASMDQGSR
jgi:ribose 5-phosphate isomerase B